MGAEPARVPHKAERLAEYFEIEDLVWETEVRPKKESGSRFDGVAKGAYLRILRKWAGGKFALIDVTRIRVAALIGAADAASGKRVLETLSEVGLIKFRGEPVKGRYTIELLDPRDVLIGRRQASDGQGELFGELASEEESTEPTSSPAALRIGGRAPALSDEHFGQDARSKKGDTAPRLPIPPAQEAAGAPALPQAKPPRPALPQRPRISRGGELPREHDLQVLDLDLKEDLSSDLSLVGKPPEIFPYGKDLKQVQDLRAGASAEKPLAGLLATVLDSIVLRVQRSRLERVEALVSLVPGLWPDFADGVIGELLGDNDALHAGEPSPLVDRELAHLVLKTRAEIENNRLRKNPGVYFSGAVNRFLTERGRKRIYVAPRKPR